MRTIAIIIMVDRIGSVDDGYFDCDLFISSKQLSSIIIGFRRIGSR